ncbi:MAG: ECF-type sigma factor [Blastocatellia bacterium]|nr:ECF-type sigma factor [Blastocatellia bacterium]
MAERKNGDGEEGQAKGGLQAVSAPITDLIALVREGDEAARGKLWGIVFPILESRARAMLNNDRVGGVIRPSDLLQEAFVQLIAREKVGWNDRRHLFGFAVMVMRNLVTDQARRRLRKEQFFTPVDEALGIVINDDVSWVEVDDLLKRLETEHGAEKARVVELRAYAGLTNEEIAEQLEISLATVKRHMKIARAFLMSRMPAPE